VPKRAGLPARTLEAPRGLVRCQVRRVGATTLGSGRVPEALEFATDIPERSPEPQAPSNPRSTPTADAQALSVEIKLALCGSAFVSVDLGPQVTRFRLPRADGSRAWRRRRRWGRASSGDAPSETIVLPRGDPEPKAYPPDHTVAIEPMCVLHVVLPYDHPSSNIARHTPLDYDRTWNSLAAWHQVKRRHRRARVRRWPARLEARNGPGEP
jgi:hypothetical protein